MGARATAATLVIVDGLSDVSAHTPLQAAVTPTLDGAAARGRSGLQDPVAPGLACGSDTAHLALLGYAPRALYRGRGAFESLGAGMPMRAGDVAFKCNLAFAAGRRVLRRCAGSGPPMRSLALELVRLLHDAVVPGFPDVQIAVTHATQHRVGLVLHGPGLSDCVSNTDPLVDDADLLTSVPTDGGSPAAVRTAAVVNELTATFRQLITKYVAGARRRENDVPETNVLLLRGASEHIDIEPFESLHGLRAFMIAPTKIIAGVGITAGIDVIAVERATGHYDTSLPNKAKACVDNLMIKQPDSPFGYRYALGIVHVKAVDEAGHEQDRDKKKLWLEKVDDMVRQILQLLCEQRRYDVVLIVTGDHTTPTVFGDHTCEPVPIVFADVFNPAAVNNMERPRYVASDDCNSFDEISAGSAGSLGRFPGIELMRLIKGLFLTNN